MRGTLQAMLTDPNSAVFLAWRGDTAVGVATIARALIDCCVQWRHARKCSAVEVCITPEGKVCSVIWQIALHSNLCAEYSGC
jgi:hypothetical protein